MDSFERGSAEEVLYLHSLWRQGPPRPNGPNPNQIAPMPTQRRYHNPVSQSLHFVNSVPFKIALRPHHRRPLRNFGSKNLEFDPPPVASDAPWPCHDPAADTAPAASGWPPFNPHSAAARPPSADELAKRAANQAQQRGLTACRDFFSGDAGSDTEDEIGDSDDEDVEESEILNFLVSVFMRDEELKAYYEKNWGKGDFSCLVCGVGSGKKKAKAEKRFKDCVALVQHAAAISKTKRRRAHRAYGQAICSVLGWDINRLPIAEVQLGCSLAKSLDSQE